MYFVRFDEFNIAKKQSCKILIYLFATEEKPMMKIFGFMLLIVATVSAAEPLATAPVQLREVEQTYSIDGVVEATRQSTVSAQISGRVKGIFFDVGDRVKQRSGHFAHR